MVSDKQRFEIDGRKQCFDGLAHVWVYRGRKQQLYSCTRCAFEITKAELQGASDA